MLRFAKSGEFSRYRECLLLLLFSLSEKAAQGRLMIELRSKVETFGCLLLLQSNFNPS